VAGFRRDKISFVIPSLLLIWLSAPAFSANVEAPPAPPALPAPAIQGPGFAGHEPGILALGLTAEIAEFNQAADVRAYLEARVGVYMNPERRVHRAAAALLLGAAAHNETALQRLAASGVPREVMLEVVGAAKKIQDEVREEDATKRAFEAAKHDIDWVMKQKPAGGVTPRHMSALEHLIGWADDPARTAVKISIEDWGRSLQSAVATQTPAEMQEMIAKAPSHLDRADVAKAVEALVARNVTEAVPADAVEAELRTTTIRSFRDKFDNVFNVDGGKERKIPLFKLIADRVMAAPVPMADAGTWPSIAGDEHLTRTYAGRAHVALLESLAFFDDALSTDGRLAAADSRIGGFIADGANYLRQALEMHRQLDPSLWARATSTVR
jgi:hypothetical protein